VKVIGTYADAEKKLEATQDKVYGLPTLHDYLQLPEWFVKYVPATDAIFAQDEVLLYMRQDDTIRGTLDFIEEGSMREGIEGMYERSRLSELSRPEDLREVDMSVAGVVPLFFTDLVERVWFDLVPYDIKEHMFAITDDFVRSMTFARTVTDMDVLSSAKSFALAFEHALVLSVAAKTAQMMSRMPKYEYISDKPDPALEYVRRVEETERKENVEREKRENLAAKRMEELLAGRIPEGEGEGEGGAGEPAAVTGVSREGKLDDAADAKNKDRGETEYDSDLEALEQEIVDYERKQEEDEEVHAIHMIHTIHTIHTFPMYTLYTLYTLLHTTHTINTIHTIHTIHMIHTIHTIHSILPLKVCHSAHTERRPHTRNGHRCKNDEGSVL
jgi:hypothetical protein